MQRPMMPVSSQRTRKPQPTRAETLTEAREALRVATDLNGSAFKRLRGLMGTTQGELASIIGVDVATVSHWERGNWKVRPVRRLQLLAACEVLLRCGGSPKQALEWMRERRPPHELEGQSPLSLMGTEEGALRVLSLASSLEPLRVVP